MDSYAKHLLGIAAMIGVVILSTAWFTKPAASGSERTAQPGAAAIEAAPAAWHGDKPQQDRQADAQTYYVALRTEPGQTVTLSDMAGNELQTLTADGDGDAAFGPVAPGRYTLRQGAFGGTFVLLDNASVAALDGTLWSDGELLHMEKVETVCLQVEVEVTPELAGRVVTVTLKAEDGAAYDRSFVAGEAGTYTVQFSALPAGTYELWQNEKNVRTLTVTGQTSQQITLAG